MGSKNPVGPAGGALPKVVAIDTIYCSASAASASERRPYKAASAACYRSKPNAATFGHLALKAFVALAVVAATLHDPLQAAIGIGCLVGVVLIEARMHTRLAR